MSKQLNESNEIWNEIKLVNSAKRISKHSSSNHKRQSIKLQIELPYMENSNDNIKMKKSSTFTESSFNNESEEEEDLNENQTIRLQISFDSRPRFTPRKVNTNKQQLQHTAKKQCSSGYSSSTSSMVNYICANNQEKSFYLANNDSTNNYNSERFSNENIYDKLNYNVSTSIKRKSMASVDSSMSSCSAASSSSSNSSFASTSKPKVYYEEISNFSQLHESKQRTYENDLIKPPPAPQVKSQVYKREYTVNEIFQNLELFKIEAKQQEKLNNNYAHKQLADKNTTTNNKPKSVSFLKQIFETKMTKKTTAVECLSGVKQQQPIKQQTKQHVYVNEKLSRP
jgi:hypothetical protein